MARPRVLSLREFARSLIQRAEASGRGAASPKRKFVPNVSLYLDPTVIRRIKRMAIELDCRPHDLLVEGVNLMLRKHGQPSAGGDPQQSISRWPGRRRRRTRRPC